LWDGAVAARVTGMSAGFGYRTGVLARQTALSIILLTATLAACELPKGDTSTPKGLHYAVLQARQQADTDAMWNLLHPDTRAAFDRWVASEKQIQRIVVIEFPKKVQPDALKVLTVQQHTSGKALFATLVTGKTDPLETWARLGARVQSVDEAGGAATVHTWGGDDLRARKHDGKWYAVLPEKLEARLMKSSEQAAKNLIQVKQLAEKLKN